MMQFGFEKEKKETKMGQKAPQEYIATSIRRLTIAQRMNKICNTTEKGGSFTEALNLEENICRRRTEIF